MKIHTVGDSHASCGWIDIKGVVPHHIGPLVCYSFGKKRLAYLDIKKFNINDGDTIVFCLGELDCRCHIFKHVTPELSYEAIIDGIVDNYFEAIKENVSQYNNLKVCVYNVVPPVEKHNTGENPSYPYLGSDEDRKNYTLYFNVKLKEKCSENGYLFVDVYDKYITEKGFLNKKYALCDDDIHIRNGCFIKEFVDENIFKT